jgi:hypothetical protein
LHDLQPLRFVGAAKPSHMSPSMPPRKDFVRAVIMFACAAAIIWLSSDALTHISEAYDELCPVQGPGVAAPGYGGDPRGYCIGIGEYISVLALIMGLAAFAVPCVLAVWWYGNDRARKGNSN